MKLLLKHIVGGLEEKEVRKCLNQHDIGLEEEVYNEVINLPVEIDEGIKNPYPENIFIPFSDLGWEKIHKTLKKHLGISLDRVSGNLMRAGFDLGVKTFSSALKSGRVVKVVKNNGC